MRSLPSSSSRLLSLQGVSVDMDDLTADLQRLARNFKVSTLVVLHRLYDAGHFTQSQYRTAYGEELDRPLHCWKSGPGGGGNFYNTQPLAGGLRDSPRALIESTRRGSDAASGCVPDVGLQEDLDVQ